MQTEPDEGEHRTASEFREACLDLFRRVGVVDRETAMPLHEYCPRSSACWAACQGRAPSGEKAHISLPFIGAHYPTTRLVVVAENLHGDGGLSEIEELVQAAKKELLERMRVRFGNLYTVYRGSFLFHHLGAYAATILRAIGHESFRSADWAASQGVPREIVIAAFEFLTFLNHVKCSPTGDRSRPNDAMWQHCGSTYLANELAILAPQIVVAIGSSQNGPRLRALLGATHEVWAGRWVSRHSRPGADVLTTPQPSYFRAKWRDVCAEIETAMEQQT